MFYILQGHFMQFIKTLPTLFQMTIIESSTHNIFAGSSLDVLQSRKEKKLLHMAIIRCNLNSKTFWMHRLSSWAKDELKSEYVQWKVEEFGLFRNNAKQKICHSDKSTTIWPLTPTRRPTLNFKTFNPTQWLDLLRKIFFSCFDR